MSIAGHAQSSIVRSAHLAGYHANIPLRWPKSQVTGTRSRPFSPVAWHDALAPLWARYSTASFIQEIQSPTIVDNGSAGDVRPSKSSAWVGEHHSASLAVKPSIPQVNTLRIRTQKNVRSRAESLAIYKKGKAFRNQMLKDHGSWSYNWRIALQDLETNNVQDGSRATVAPPILENRKKIPIPHNVPVDEIRPPATWTIASFHEYIIQLTSSRVDGRVSQAIQPDRHYSHTVAVADVLARLFTDPAAKYAVSVGAGNVALNFLLDNGKFAHGRDLFAQLQELQQDTHPSTFNIMLGAASKQKDLHAFTYILKMMIIHRVPPTVLTWLHLAHVVRDDAVRMIIIDRMVEKGMLKDSATMKKAVALLMPQLVVKYLDSRNGAHELLEALDNHFGSEWCSTIAAESLIDGVCVRYSADDALKILGQLYDRGYRPTQGMLLLLLRQCSWSRAHEFAVDLLCLFRKQYTIEPSMQIYDLLFKQVWRSRLYNCCRVLWIHACVHGRTSFDMRRMVKESLYIQKRASSAAQSRSDVWKETVGKIITGHSREKHTTNFQALISLCGPSKPSRGDRDRYLRSARSIYDDDLAAVTKYRIQKPLDKLLHEALRADRQWALGRALTDIPVECKYSQIIDVALTRIPASGTTNHAQGGSTRADGKTDDASGCCWMSDEMRTRPCVCPAHVKKASQALSNVGEREREATA